MTNKLTSEIALGLAKEIEVLEGQISAVYRKAGDFDGLNNANLIRDIVNARRTASDAASDAEGLIESLNISEGDPE